MKSTDNLIIYLLNRDNLNRPDCAICDKCDYWRWNGEKYECVVVNQTVNQCCKGLKNIFMINKEEKDNDD